MKKAKAHRAEDMRAEYRRQDFPAGLVRGRYAARLASGSSIVILEPEIAAAFPDSRAVNDALGMVLRAARTAALAQPANKAPRTTGKRRRSA